LVPNQVWSALLEPATRLQLVADLATPATCQFMDVLLGV
jgi:hypothetical protein